MDTKPMPKCPQCGAILPPNAPAGLCPKCLMALNLKTETVLSNDPTPAQPALPPEQIAPHFPQLEILECLGRGGMGVVYKARQKSLNRLVALKLLAPERANDAQFAARFEKEACALAALNHPNIVTIYDHGQAGGFYYLLMEFVDGVTLRQLLAKERVSAREALAIVPQICDALQFAHDQGIVHRDIKPENLLLDRRGRVKVADFGLAKMIAPVAAVYDSRESGEQSQRQSQTAATENLTDAGKVMGTPQYMSPEQIQAPGEVDHRADIYALGVVFYQMLTGELPGKKIEPPSKKVSIDVRLDEVVLRALEKKPELRYQQASILKTQVETIAESPGPRSSGRESAHTESQSQQTLPQSRWTRFMEQIFGTPENCGGFKRRWDHVMLAGCVSGIISLVLMLLNKVGVPMDAAVLQILTVIIFLAALGISVAVTRKRKLKARMIPPGSSRGDEAQTETGKENQSRLPAAATSQESRFSRTAIVGACCGLLPLLVLPVTQLLLSRGIPFDLSKPPAWVFIFGAVQFLLLVVGCVGMPILGWMAVSQIRRSAGKLHGLWLAVFDGLLFPLLTIDACIVLLDLVGRTASVPLSIPNVAARVTTMPFQVSLLLLAIIAAVDWFIIRRVWRAVNKPLTDSTNRSCSTVRAEAAPSATPPNPEMLSCSTSPATTQGSEHLPPFSFGLVLAYAGTMLFGGVAQMLTGFGRDKWLIVLFGLIAASSVALAFLLNKYGDEKTRRTFRRSAAVGALVAALPVIGFALFFLYALSQEHGGWNPAVGEAIIVPLIWLGAVLLPVSFWRLTRGSARISGVGVLGLLLCVSIPIGLPAIFYHAAQMKQTRRAARELELARNAEAAAAARDARSSRLMVERVSKGSAAVASQNNFTVRGRVVDEQGNGLGGVTIAANCGGGTLRRTGTTESRADGSYELGFHLGMRFLSESNQPPSANIQVATIIPKKPGYFDANLNRQGDLLMGDRLPAPGEDVGWKVDTNKLVLPGRPFELNFVLLPAAKITGTLRDENGSPLTNCAVSLVGEKLPPSQNVFVSTDTDANGAFQLADLPTNGRWWLSVWQRREKNERGKRTEFRSEEFTLPKPGAYEFEVERESTNAAFGLQIRLTQTPPTNSPPQAKP